MCSAVADGRLPKVGRFDRSQPNKLDTNIEYQVIATNNVYNLVYPFYLQKSP